MEIIEQTIEGTDLKIAVDSNEESLFSLLKAYMEPMADVEVVATYELFNINRKKLEALIHKFFNNARLDIQIEDRFGNPIVPREWFLVPLFVIDDVVKKIREKTITDYEYDTDSASIIPIAKRK